MEWRTDLSDHSIRTRGGNRELYEWMTSFLLEKWGKGGESGSKHLTGR